MNSKIDNDAFIALLRDELGENAVSVTRQKLNEICVKRGVKMPSWFVNDPDRRMSRGVYALDKSTIVPKVPASTIVSQVPVSGDLGDFMNDLNAAAMQNVMPHAEINLVPSKAKGYVPFGNFNDVRSIIKSKRFYPTYITGLSGNGKTMMVEQACAAEKREIIRVNVTVETDEDDLIGGFRLVNNQTIWQDGPVVHAMKRGAVLLLDEIDLASNKIMCLQPVLEGKTVFIKKTNTPITPAAGFNVIATANTKGKGSDDGRFIGTNVMNEAFLERFSITMEQEYPSEKTEARILTNVLQNGGVEDKEFVNMLVKWADTIRKAFMDGGVSDIISTRRLVHICEAYMIFGHNREKAITLCLNRFDTETKTQFLQLYSKFDVKVDPNAPKTDPQYSPDQDMIF